MIDWHQLDATPEQLAAETRGNLRRHLLPGAAGADAGAARPARGARSGRHSQGDRHQQRPRRSSSACSASFNLAAAIRRSSSPARTSSTASRRRTCTCSPPQRHGVAPAEMMVLEDSQIGCQAAVAAGAYTVAVPHGQSLTAPVPRRAVRRRHRSRTSASTRRCGLAKPGGSLLALRRA